MSLYFRFPLSFREVEELMLERGVTVSYESIRRWCRKFGQAYANAMRRRRPRPGDKWHLDEVFIRIGGVHKYLWRAIDADGKRPRHPRPEPEAGRKRAGHDASPVPDVPAARVQSRVTDGEPGVFFTYKVEYGAEPLVQLSLPRSWARQVAGAGWAVVDGRPVTDVLEWDHSVTPARPALVRAALICADYDAGMHGWRAHADNRTCRVAWTRRGTASLVMPWE